MTLDEGIFLENYIIILLSICFTLMCEGLVTFITVYQFSLILLERVFCIYVKTRKLYCFSYRSFSICDKHIVERRYNTAINIHILTGIQSFSFL
jgi:hypothetical protein